MSAQQTQMIAANLQIVQIQMDHIIVIAPGVMKAMVVLVKVIFIIKSIRIVTIMINFALAIRLVPSPPTISTGTISRTFAVILWEATSPGTSSISSYTLQQSDSTLNWVTVYPIYIVMPL